MPSAARTWLPAARYHVATAITALIPAAILRRDSTPVRSPRFHGSMAPTTTNISSTANNGPKVRLKNGGPTEMVMSIALRTSGLSVPNRTTMVAVQISRLLSSSAPSRETGAKRPPPLSLGARTA